MTGLPENQTRIKNILTYNDGVLVCLRSDPVSRGVPPGNPGGTLGSPVPSRSCSPAERLSHLGRQIDSKIEAEIPLSGIFFIAALDARGISPPIVHTQSRKQSWIYTINLSIFYKHLYICITYPRLPSLLMLISLLAPCACAEPSKNCGQGSLGRGQGSLGGRPRVFLTVYFSPLVRNLLNWHVS